MEIRVGQETEVNVKTIMLPEHHSTALPSTSEVAENRQGELPERRIRFNDSFQARDYAGLCSFFLTTLVESAKVIARLEDVIR